MKRFKFLLLLAIIFLGLLGHNVQPAKSQSSEQLPVYIVQAGDTLNSIAIRFGISTTDIINANGISDPNLLGAGAQLLIPGLEGMSGILSTQTVTLGDSLSSLSLSYQVPQPKLITLNRITSPSELYVGANLIIPQDPDNGTNQHPSVQQNSQTILDTASSHGINPWQFTLANNLTSPWLNLPGDQFALPVTGSQPSQQTIDSSISQVKLPNLPFVQGSTTSILVKSNFPITLSGSLGKWPLNFFPVAENEYVALQGIYRMTQPGIYPLTISGSSTQGHSFTFEQPVIIAPMIAIYDYSLSVDPVTIDKNNTQPEDDLVKSIVQVVSDEKYWANSFSPPIDIPQGYLIFPDCTTSRYGNLRSYNNGPYNYFHTGLDLSACGNNLNVYAAAPGKVVFAELLTVRGNYVVIDHGWGIYSAYGHLSEISVSVGDVVDTGQLIGLIGATGRVDGPHLHWEVWVNTVQVDPLDWLNYIYP